MDIIETQIPDPLALEELEHEDQQQKGDPRETLLSEMIEEAINWREENVEPEQAEVTMRAASNVILSRDDAESMVKLLETLDDLDDVQQVYSNADISEEILAEIA